MCDIFKRKIKKTSLKKPPVALQKRPQNYPHFLDSVVSLLEAARRSSARAVNSIMTVTYWEIGRRIFEIEQKGKSRAEYGQRLISRLSGDLTSRFGRGFSERNLEQMRAFYANFSSSIPQALPAELGRAHFPLSWTHYVSLLTVENPQARAFYHAEALREGWSSRQLERQINTQFFERTALSRNKVKMLTEGAKATPQDALTPEEEIKDPFVLEFLNLKDEYSETELEDALVQHLETFLMELGGDFTFVGRQKRLRLDDEWFRVDLVFFHRALRCLILIDLKIGKFVHADAGQMHMYLNYAKEHWTRPGENPPVGLILCAKKGESVAKYSLEGLSNKVLAAQYRTTLPQPNQIVEELEKTQTLLEHRKKFKKKPSKEI